MEAVPNGPDSTVDLLLLHARFTVAREVGFAVFERNAMLLSDHRIEFAEVALDGPPATVLHLALGAQPVALVDPTPPPDARADHEHEPRPVGEVSELFPEIDRL